MTALLTVFFVLAMGALILTLVHAAGKVPLWISVLLLTIIELLRCLPLGR